MVTAQANLDLARGGEWRTDYSAWHGQLNIEIEALFTQYEQSVVRLSDQYPTWDELHNDELVDHERL
jgi:hypothetical protein